MREVIRLDEAKRSAALAVTELADKETEDERQDATTKAFKAELNVVKRRIDLLNRLLKQPSDTPKLCLEIKKGSNTHQQTAVQYKCFTEDEGLLYPTQSPIAWPCLFAWTGLHKLCPPPNYTSGSAVAEETQLALQTLVKLALMRPCKDIATTQLRKCSAEIFPAGKTHPNMKFERMPMTDGDMQAHWQLPQTSHKSHHTYKASLGQHLTIHVLWGTMEINYCDQWHNPLINAFVRNTVLHVGAEAIHAPSDDESVNPSNFMHNFLKPVIRVQYHKDIHVLTLSPFAGPETCSVNHIHLSKGWGILQLHDKAVKDVGTPDEPKTHPMQYYHCVGSRPNTRFNEQELNYIHARGFLSAEIDVTKLPDPDTLKLDTGRAKAKSARISFTDWDVLVSSYTGKREASTVITLINYPPHNMRFPKPSPKLNVTAQPFIPAQEREKPIDEQPLREGKAFYVKWFSQHGNVAWKINLVDTEDPDRQASQRMKQFMTKVRTDFQAKLDNLGNPLWMSIPQSKHAFTLNVRYNPHKFDGKTLLDLYREQWGKFITQMINDNNRNHGDNDHFHPVQSDTSPYFYSQAANSMQRVTYNKKMNKSRPISVWEDVFYAGRQTEEAGKSYWHYSQERHTRDSSEGRINEGYLAMQATEEHGPMTVIPDRLPIMAASMHHHHSTLVLQQMKEKLRMLQEAKACEESHAQNQKHLLHQVLERLQHGQPLHTAARRHH